MPTLDLDYSDVLRVSIRFFKTFDRPHAVRGTIELNRYMIEDVQVISMSDYRDHFHRLNILFGGRRIVILETARTPPLSPWYTVRGTDAALVEARLRDLI